MDQMEEVSKKIEERRSILYSMGQLYAFTSSEMLAVSQELDDLINLYERLRYSAGTIQEAGIAL